MTSIPSTGVGPITGENSTAVTPSTPTRIRPKAVTRRRWWVNGSLRSGARAGIAGWEEMPCRLTSNKCRISSTTINPGTITTWAAYSRTRIGTFSATSGVNQNPS